jgi:hypothetical protein
VISSVHFGPSAANREWRSQRTRISGSAADWHVYQLDWRSDLIQISIDDRSVLRMDPSEARRYGDDPLRQNMFLRLNLALGDWGGVVDPTLLPVRFEIQSVSIWEAQE